MDVGVLKVSDVDVEEHLRLSPTTLVSGSLVRTIGKWQLLFKESMMGLVENCGQHFRAKILVPLHKLIGG
jgi:hypothetical protein